MIKVVAVLAGAIVAAVFAAKLLYDATIAPDVDSTAQPWAQHRMEFVAWNDERWTAWVRNDKFVLLPHEPGKWQRHINPSLAFIDWHGEPWQAKIDGDEFVLARRGNWRGRAERAEALRYLDWRGSRQLRTVAQLTGT